MNANPRGESRKFVKESGGSYRVKFVVGWALLAVIVALVLSIPVFLLMVALTQLTAALVKVERDNGRSTLKINLFKKPIQSVAYLLPAMVFFAFAAAAFTLANTSVIAILLS